MKTNVVVWIGTSITAGNHLGSPTTERASHLCEVAIPSIAANSHNIGVPSSWIDTSSQGAAADALYDGTKQINICVIEFGVNDMINTGGDESAATYVTSNLKPFCAARRATGFKLIVLQTMAINGNSTFNGRRDSANALVIADPSFYEAYVDLGSMGLAATTADTTYFSDGVHPTATGETIRAPFITTALTNLLTSTGGVSRTRMQLCM